MVSVQFYNSPGEVDLFNFQNLDPAVINEQETASLIVLTRKGLIKRTLLSEYPVKGRATGGVATLTLNPGDGIVATRLSINPDEPLLIVTETGGVMQMVSQVALLPRAKKGQPLPAKTSAGGPGRIVPLALT